MTSDARLALDERDVREVEAADLVDAGHDLEQAVDRVQLRLAPEARVDAWPAPGRRGTPVALVVPDDPAVGGADDARVEPADEAAARVLEVLGVVEGQGRADGLVRDPDGIGRRGAVA